MTRRSSFVILMLGLVVVCLTAPAAHASFSGSVSGAWVNPVPDGSYPTFTGVGTSSFTWGDSGGYGTPPSGLQFSGNGFSSVASEAAVPLGTVTYYNGTIGSDTGASAVSLMMTVSISSPTSASFTPTFTLELVNVPNNSGGWADADYVYFPSALSGETFTLDGAKYKLEIIGFSQDGGATTVKQFQVLEDAQTSAVLYGRITRNSTYYLPYFTSGDGWWSGVALRNGNHTQNANTTVTVYSYDGSVINTQNTLLPARGQTAFVAGSGLSADGWIKVRSDQPLAGLSFFGLASDYTVMADIPFASYLSALLYIPHVAQNDQWDTYVYVCNPNDTATDITLNFVNGSGSVIATAQHTIPANGMDIYPLADLLSSSHPNGSVEISATQGVAAFALYTDFSKTSKGFNFAGIAAVDPNK